MTASLYQSGSPAAGTGAAVVTTSAERESMSISGHSVGARAHARCGGGQLEDMSRCKRRIQAHEVVGALPAVTGAREQVMHFEWLVGVQAEDRQVERNPPALRPAHIEVDDDKNRIACSALGITNELLVVDRMKRERPVGLQCRVGAADLVDARNQ